MKQTEIKLRTKNPATEAILKEYNIMTKEQISYISAEIEIEHS